MTEDVQSDHSVSRTARGPAEVDSRRAMAEFQSAANQPRSWVARWRRARANQLMLVSLVVLIAIHLIVFVGPLAWTVPPDATHPLDSLVPISAAHPLGADDLGRDELARVLAGGRVTLIVGFSAMLTSVVLGMLVGAIAGFYGGWINIVLMRLTDALMAVPSFFLIITAVTVLGAGPVTLVLVIGLTSWMQVTRVVYGETLRWKTREFVQAAEAIGASRGRILLRHIMPQTVPSVIVSASLGVGWAILTASAMSYLGLGIQPPTPSWGNMLQNAQQYVFTAPSLAVYPGLLITLTVLAYNFVGDGLRDVLDPRLKM